MAPTDPRQYDKSYPSPWLSYVDEIAPYPISNSDTEAPTTQQEESDKERRDRLSRENNQRLIESRRTGRKLKW